MIGEKIQYALKDNVLVSVDQVEKGMACNCICPACKSQLVARKGEVREHHFRHKEVHCSWESYLHKLGKKRLKERFDSQKEFIIKYFVEHHCDKVKGCKLESIYK